jgi:hypothetical protein
LPVWRRQHSLLSPHAELPRRLLPSPQWTSLTTEIADRLINAVDNTSASVCNAAKPERTETLAPKWLLTAEPEPSAMTPITTPLCNFSSFPKLRCGYAAWLSPPFLNLTAATQPNISIL